MQRAAAWAGPSGPQWAQTAGLALSLTLTLTLTLSLTLTRYVPFETRYPPEWVHDPEAEEPKMELVRRLRG